MPPCWTSPPRSLRRPYPLATPRDLAQARPALPGRGVPPARSVTSTLLWLVSDDAADITGVDIEVDDGAHVLPRLNAHPADQQA